MIFTPADPLELETRYTVTVGAGIRDPAGNAMTEPARRRSTFETDRPARGREHRTRPTATSDVAIDAPIEIDLLDAHGHRVGRGRAAPHADASGTSCAGAASC